MNKKPFVIAPRMPATLASLLVLGSLAAAQTELHFYELGESQMNMDKASNIARTLGLTQMKDPNGGPLPIWVMADGSVRGTLSRGMFYVSPDLPRAKKPAPTDLPAVQKTAQAYLQQFGILPDDRSLWTAKFNFWTKQSSDAAGNIGAPLTPIVGVQFQRSLDKLPVFGPASAVTVDVDALGVAGGVASVRPAILMDKVVVPKSDKQIQDEYLMLLAIRKRLEHGTPKLVEKRKCYWEEDLGFIQPVMLYKVLFTDESGNQSAAEIPVPIAKNLPEPLQKSNFNGFVPIMPADGGDGGGRSRVSNLRLGEYVVRQDSDPGICLSVVNAFYNNSAFFAPFTGHSVSRVQYYWDHDWLWQDTASFSNNCRYYAGSVDMAATVAHASPWRFTCLSNYGETVELKNMSHFGANAGGGGNPDQCYTSYLLFASCSMIPAPGDPYGGSYQSPSSPFGVWWNMFWGLHGVYGFRTTAGKSAAVDAFGGFGLRTGLCHPNVAAWLDTTSSLDHGSNWNYGSIVIATGKESDIIFNTTARAKATSLTMWWNHS
ncbi:MAG TPA: hypothetical protein VK934_01980 [Fimbriimonas sp.]|nr:hypothetical protein [Fimbriimonas sp.]